MPYSVLSVSVCKIKQLKIKVTIYIEFGKYKTNTDLRCVWLIKSLWLNEFVDQIIWEIFKTNVFLIHYSLFFVTDCIITTD